MEGSDWVVYAIMAASAAAQAISGWLQGHPGNVAYSGNKADKFVKWLGPKLMAGLPDDAIAKMHKPFELNFADMPQRQSVNLLMPHTGGAMPGGAGLIQGKEAAGGYSAGPPGGGAVGGGARVHGAALTGGGAQGAYQGGGLPGGPAGGQNPDPEGQLPHVLQLINTIESRGYLPTGRNTGFQGAGGRRMV